MVLRPQDRPISIILTVLLALLAAVQGRALDPDRHITQYMQSAWTSGSGLPQNSVHGIAQTSDGYIWLATEEGLARFDGSRFRVFARENYPGLASDYLRTLAAGPKSDLWIGTDSGLTHYTPSAGVPAPENFQSLTTRDGLLSGNVFSLCLDRDGSLWVGTLRGLNRVRNGRVENWSRGHALPETAVYALTLDRQGVLWVGTDAGLARLDGDRFTLFSAKDGMPAGRVSALAAAPDGSLWVGTRAAGLLQLRQGRATVSALQLPGKEIDALLVDRNGSLWISFDRHGIGRLAGGRLETYDTARGLPSDLCSPAILEDREGSLWFGFLDAGMVQLREGRFAVFGRPEGLSGDYVGNILQAPDGAMWFGVDSAGVNRLLPDGSVQAWDWRRGLPAQAQFSMASTRDGSLWIGYREATLARIRNGQVSIYHDPGAPGGTLVSLFEDRDGQLWAGYYGKGVARFSNGRFEHISNTEMAVQMAQSPDGALWIATDGDGLLRYSNGLFTRFGTASGLPSDHVQCLLADPDGSIWAGTSSGGLSLLRAGHVVYTWTFRQGLPAPTVGSLVDDGIGNLWMGSDNGIFRVSRAELLQTLGKPTQPLHPVLYGLKDGLRSLESLFGSMPVIWRDRSGRLWFATIRGAATIDPARVVQPSSPPPVWIEQLSYDSKPVPLAPSLRLGPGGGNLEIDFTSPSFIAPQLVRCRYRLVGFDRDWVEAGARRTAYYTNLPAGRYIFQVQAASIDGVWNPAGASMALFLRPPLSRTWVAYVLYFLALIFALWLAIALRTRHLTRRQRELNRIVAERTAQLEREKASLVEARNQLQILATHDSLTGLFNRGAMLEHLEREISRAVRDKTTLGVLMADLDHFKRVNDQYGHLCGDEVLRETAARLRSVMRGYDVAGRLGGEEFLILFPDFDLQMNPSRIDDLLDSIRCRPFLTAQGSIAITCSVGIGTFRPDSDAVDPLAVIGRADEALYAAKHSGRNCARFELREDKPPAAPEDSALL